MKNSRSLDDMIEDLFEPEPETRQAEGRLTRARMRSRNKLLKPSGPAKKQGGKPPKRRRKPATNREPSMAKPQSKDITKDKAEIRSAWELIQNCVNGIRNSGKAFKVTTTPTEDGGGTLTVQWFGHQIGEDPKKAKTAASDK